MLECYPILYLDGLKLCKFVSRSDLVLDADHALDFLRTYLVLQGCISYWGASDKCGALLFLRCSHINAVVRVFALYGVPGMILITHSLHSCEYIQLHEYGRLRIEVVLVFIPTEAQAQTPPYSNQQRRKTIEIVENTCLLLDTLTQ